MDLLLREYGGGPATIAEWLNAPAVLTVGMLGTIQSRYRKQSGKPVEPEFGEQDQDIIRMLEEKNKRLTNGDAT